MNKRNWDIIPFKDTPPMTYFLQLGPAFFLFPPSNNVTTLGLNQGVNPVVGAEFSPFSLVTKIGSTNRGPGFNTQALGKALHIQALTTFILLQTTQSVIFQGSHRKTSQHLSVSQKQCSQEGLIGHENLDKCSIVELWPQFWFYPFFVGESLTRLALNSLHSPGLTLLSSCLSLLNS